MVENLNESGWLRAMRRGAYDARRSRRTSSEEARMFTGLVEALGTVRSLRRTSGGALLSVETPFTKELTRGESVSVNGACLTAVSFEGACFAADVSNESLAKTTLGELSIGDAVNLERALAVGARMGGHSVLGHVDGVGRVSKVSPLGDARAVEIEFPKELAAFFVSKGSVAIDGISLTINTVGARCFSVAIIPETWAKTVVSKRPVGARVNLEGDILGKYVLRSLALAGRTSAVTEKFLQENGYL